MRRWAALALVVMFLVASVAAAQRGRNNQRGGNRMERGLRFATLEDFDGSFQFCRIIFRNSIEGDGGGWSVDWPRADINFSVRLSELTKTHVGRDATGGLLWHELVRRDT